LAIATDLKVLRISVVHSRFHRRTPRPGRRVITDLAGRLKRYDAVCYSPRGPEYREIEVCPNTVVHPTRSRSKLHFLLDAWRIAKRLHAEHNYDLISAGDPMASGLVGYWLKRRFGVPLLLKVHSDYYSSPAWRRESLRYRLFDHWLSIRVLRRADHVRVVSRQLAEDVVRLGVDPDRVTQLPTVMRTFLYSPGEDTLERYGAGRLLVASRLIHAKDLGTLLQAMRQLIDRGYSPNLTIAGRGAFRDRLEEQSRRLGLGDQVTFVGFVPQDELPAYYQQASIFVIPSVYDALPKTVVEAGLCGLPAVGTRVGGIPQLIEDGANGLLVPPGDPDALADALATLLDNPERTRQLGREVRRRFAEEWDYEDLVDRQIALLERVASER
jgi:glycogen synthase